MDDMLSRMVSLPRRVSTETLEWVNDNPLPVAGVTMAVLAGGYLFVLILSAADRTNTTVVTLDPSLMVAIVGDRPAYLLAIVVGVGMLLWRE